MHLGTNLSARQVVRAVGVSGGLALAFFFAGAVMAAPQGGSGPTTSTTSCTTTTTQQCSTTSTSTPTTSSTSTPTTSSNTASTPKTTSTSSATSTGGASQSGSETANGQSQGTATNTGTGSCGCSNGTQTAKDKTTSTTTQIIVQVAPTTAIATATNYGHGSATATAVASPTQTATVSSDTRANDPAMNTGNDHSTANSTASDTTNQEIDQTAPTTAVATATNYGNGSASASAVAAPTQSASISDSSRATDDAGNVGLNGCDCSNGSQSAGNTTSNTTSQSITQTASATADATATNGQNCECEWWGNGTGSATAVAVASPKQTASESSSSSVSGSANNTGYGNGHQSANNTSSNTTDQSIDQYAPTTATATATNDGGHHSNQTASAVADAQPTQVAIEASSAWVNGSANNIGVGNGYACNCGNDPQSATNTSSNYTDQSINQAAPTTATATATNDGSHGTQSATAAAVASPSQKAGETSSVTVNGSASNYSLGQGDQIALNFSTNTTDQSIDQCAPTTATATATNDGHKANQSASALASANPSETAALASGAKVTGEAINTNVNTSDDCGCEGGHGAHQYATNYSTNITNQTITQNAPTIATATATNNGFSYSEGEGIWNSDTSCDCGNYGDHGDHGNHDSWNSNQSATAVAAAAPVQEAAIGANATVNGQAVNTNTGNGNVHQTATNHSDLYDLEIGQSINQDAGTDVTATAENTPGSHSVSQSAVATAAGAPMQAAAITSNASVNGAALNTANNSDSSDCVCYDSHGHGYQSASNTSESYVNQSVDQYAPTTVTATATNDQAFAGNGGEQVATAIAAAKPTQGASLSDSDSVYGAAVNVGQGNGHQHASNDSDSVIDQSVDQNAPTTSTADAENEAGFVGDDNTQVASAVSAAAPAQAASIWNSGSVTGSAANVDLGGHSGHQTANNSSYNEVDQYVTQDAPTTATAEATNLIAFAGDDNSQSVSAVSAAAPKQSATLKGAESVSGSASNVGLGHGHQDAENTSDNYLYQAVDQEAPTTADANAENSNVFGGWNDHQSTTASAGAAPSQSASQSEADLVQGSASNAAIASGHFGSQYAYNDSENNPETVIWTPSQYILQCAPTSADATATNGLYSSDNENLPVSAVAASAPSQSGSQVATNGANGKASNTGVASGCECGFGSQDAENSSYNTSEQGLTQQSANEADANAAASAYDADGDWSGNDGEFGCGCNALAPFFGVANTNNSHVTTGANQTSSSTANNTNNSAPSFNGLGSSDLSIDLPNLGISFSLGMSNTLVIGMPSVQQLLNGSAQVSLLHGATGLNMHLSITTPWVQYAEAVAQVTPFQVLFGYTSTPSVSWLGGIL